LITLISRGFKKRLSEVAKLGELTFPKVTAELAHNLRRPFEKLQI